VKRPLYLWVAAFFLSFVFIVHSPGRAFADYSPGQLQCDHPEISQIQLDSIDNTDSIDGHTRKCDLAIDKQVSVNDGQPIEANSADQAVPVTVGDTVTWIITVTNDSSQDRYPTGQVIVSDNLPEGVSLTNASATTGEYDDSNGQWTFTLPSVDDYSNNWQATLTLTTTATTVGLIENTASLSDYTPPCDQEDPPYSDADNTNNSHSAYINVAAKQSVATVTTTSSSAPAAPNTGFGIALTNPWTFAGIGGGSFTILGSIAYGIRKKANYIPRIKA